MRPPCAAARSGFGAYTPAAATAACPGATWCRGARYFGALTGMGFDGHLALETYNTALPGFALARGVFQDLCPDGDEFARRGLAFVRDEFSRPSGG